MFSLFDYIIHLLNKILKKIETSTDCKIRYLFAVPYDNRSLTNITNVAEKRSAREQLIKLGIELFQTQYNTIRQV